MNISSFFTATKFLNRQLVLVVLALLVVVSLRQVLVSFDSVSLPNQLQDFMTLSLSIFVEAFPFLVLGSLLASIVNTYIKPAWLQAVLPKRGWLRRGCLSLLGFLFPVCECGNVPLSRALMMGGLKPAESITFLLAAPVINPVTIWSTWAAFGYDSSIVWSRIVATLLIANIIGFVIAQKKPQSALLTPSFNKACRRKHNENEEGAVGKTDRWRIGGLSSRFSSEALIMVKMLAFGVLIAGAIQTFVPRDFLVSIGSNVVLSIVAMLLLAFVVSICANVDAFFALSFANTFTAGSIVSFLVFGPMIDIKMLTLLKTTFKTEFLVVVSVLSLVMSALAGLVVSYAF